MEKTWKTPEYEANLERVKERFPGQRLLEIKQMAWYLGYSDGRGLYRRYGIRNKTTVETFRMRISK